MFLFFINSTQSVINCITASDSFDSIVKYLCLISVPKSNTTLDFEGPKRVKDDNAHSFLSCLVSMSNDTIVL